MPRTQRPRSLVTHLIHLTGAHPVDARMFINSSGRAAIKRLGIKPAVKTRTKSTITGRHLITAPEPGVKKHVRRRKSVPVHRWTLAQFTLILYGMNPRKAEYKQMRQDAFDTLAVIDKASTPLRRLPRHRRWSKHRHNR